MLKFSFSLQYCKKFYGRICSYEASHTTAQKDRTSALYGRKMDEAKLPVMPLSM